MSVKVKVFLALVEHRHGTNLYAGGTEDELRDKLYAYVAENWGEFMEDRPIPKSKKAAISQYFDTANTFGHQGAFLICEPEEITLPEVQP